LESAVANAKEKKPGDEEATMIEESQGDAHIEKRSQAE
jgi:hypothetical protein